MKKGRWIEYILIAVFCFITIWCLIFSYAGVSIEGTVLPNLSYTRVVLFGISVVLLFVIRQLCELINQLSDKAAKAMIACISLAILGISIFLIMKLSPYATSDSWKQLEFAKLLAENPDFKLDASYWSFQYFANYGNTYFFTLILALIYRLFFMVGIGQTLLPFFVLNAVCVWTGILFLTLAVYKIRGIHAATRFLAISALNPIFYWVVFWVYSNSFSIPFICVLIYLEIQYFCEVKTVWQWIYAVLICVISALGFYVRAIAVFPLIAFLMILVFVTIFRKYEIKKLIRVILLLAVIWIPMFGLTDHLSQIYFSEARSYNFPAAHWIMMGITGDGRYSTELSDFTLSFDTKEEKYDAIHAAIKNSASELGVSGIAKLYFTKIANTFADGYSELDWRLKYTEQTNAVTNFLYGVKSDWYWLYCSAYRSVLLFMALWAACSYLKNLTHESENSLFWIALITVIGGYAFYSFWEAKGQYSIPFLPVLICLAEMGASEMGDCKLLHVSRRQLYHLAIIMVYVLCYASLFLPATQNLYAQNQIIWNTSRGETNGPGVTDEMIEQQFIASGSFDEIDILILEITDPKAKYLLEILDENDTVIQSRTVTAKHVNEKQMLVWRFDPILSERKEYILRISKQSKTDGGISFQLQHIETPVYLFTPASIGGEEANTYLRMIVRNRSKASVYSYPEYFSVVLLGMIVVLLTMRIKYGKFKRD